MRSWFSFPPTVHKLSAGVHLPDTYNFAKLTATGIYDMIKEKEYLL